jgi:ketosteroid isomerase-like protein
MKTRCVVSLMVLAAFTFMPQPAIADDLADLNATVDTIVKLFNAGKVAEAVEYYDDNFISIGYLRGFPRVWRGKAHKAQIIKVYTKFWETHTFRLQYYKKDCRIIGNVGLVWGVQEQNRGLKNGPTKRYFLKASHVLKKSEGKWKVVLSHYTPIPQMIELD